MKNVLLVFVGLFSFIPIVFTQNLVPDPGFELSPMTMDSTWKKTYGSVDLFDTLMRGNKKQVLQINSFANPKPHSGLRQIGAIYDHFNHVKTGETTHIKLQSLLKANTVYEISMYAKLYEGMNHPMEYIPIMFLNEEPQGGLGNVKFAAIKNDKKFVSQHSTWEKITGFYTAKGGEQYLAIGNFKNANYKQLYENAAAPYSTYYFIDDISVTVSKEAALEINTVETLKPKSRFYTQRPIELTFKTKSTDITTEYQDTMNERLTFLRENPSVILKIAGHTDNVGNNEQNQTLSEQRAKETAQFFIKNGITESRLIVKGYGEEKPIADNETEKGRQQNRRVTIDFEINSFNEIQQNALYDFAKIYGYVRYFHPSDQAQEINWNEFAVFGVHELRSCQTAEDCQMKLAELFDLIAPSGVVTENETGQTAVLNCLKQRKIPHKYYEYLGISGGNDVYSHQLVNRETKERLIDKEPSELFVKGNLKIGGSYQILTVLPDFEMKKDFSALQVLQNKIGTTQFFKEDLYIGNTLILWNLAQHFYPYFDELPHLDWEAELEKILMAATKVHNDEDFFAHLKYCSTLIEDGHSKIGKNRKHGQMWLPFEVELANETLVVTRTGAEGVEVGDVIERLDGKKALDIFQADTALISGSTSWKKGEGLVGFGINDQYSKVNIQFKRGSRIENVVVTRDWADYEYDFIQKLDNDIYYVKLTDVYNIDTVLHHLPDLANAKGIIWDVRGYLQNEFTKLLPYFITEKDTAKWLAIPEIISPDQKGQTFTWEGWEIEPAFPTLKMPMVFLTNGKAISASESFLMFIDHYNIGEIIGEPTAGANGSRNWQSLYGGYRFHWTGMKVRHFNGKPFHKQGVQPDILLYPKYEDLIKGRDTVLERAFEILKN